MDPQKVPTTSQGVLPTEQAHLSGQLEELYGSLQRYKHYFRRFLRPADVEDIYHDFVLTLSAQLKRGELRNPGAFAAYAGTIARRMMYSHLYAHRVDMQLYPGTLSLAAPGLHPEALTIKDQQQAIAARILRSLPDRERQILVDFYLHGKTKEQICAECGLSETQFRLLKNRSKTRFTNLCQARFARQGRKGLTRLLPNTSREILP